MKPLNFAFLVTKKTSEENMVVKATDQLNAIFRAQEIDPSYTLNGIVIKPLGPFQNLLKNGYAGEVH